MKDEWCLPIKKAQRPLQNSKLYLKEDSLSDTLNLCSTAANQSAEWGLESTTYTRAWLEPPGTSPCQPLAVSPPAPPHLFLIPVSQKISLELLGNNHKLKQPLASELTGIKSSHSYPQSFMEIKPALWPSPVLSFPIQTAESNPGRFSLPLCMWNPGVNLNMTNLNNASLGSFQSLSSPSQSKSGGRCKSLVEGSSICFKVRSTTGLPVGRNKYEIGTNFWSRKLNLSSQFC